MRKQKYEILYFIYWGIGTLGVSIILITIILIILYVVLNKEILWNRVLINLFLGLFFTLASSRLLRKLKGFTNRN